MYQSFCRKSEIKVSIMKSKQGLDVILIFILNSWMSIYGANLSGIR
jgi:hypothetical protein